MNHRRLQKRFALMLAGLQSAFGWHVIASAAPFTLDSNCHESVLLDSDRPPRVARAREGADAFWIEDARRCPGQDADQCAARARLDRAKSYLAGAEADGWVCLNAGERSGWAPVDRLLFEPLPVHKPAQWSGTYAHSYGKAFIRLRADGNKIAVQGCAEWGEGILPGGNVHQGDLDGSAEAEDGVVMIGEPEQPAHPLASPEQMPNCVARLVRFGDGLIVSDNHKCGGMNVNFDGVYRRTRVRTLPGWCEGISAKP
jgi:hypothetical protein